jgi:hypothetical protein
MHPNTYLRTLWRSETLDQVFVAMSFERRFAERYDDVIKPAIESEPIAGRQLTAYKVDNAQTGDSILTDIANGIAHSAIVLADVSVIDEGRYAEQPIRNGNVMYEVGLALSCRLPSEVLLIRDDQKKFLFDVSTIPHITVDFSAKNEAIDQIRNALRDRLSETNKIHDARVTIAMRQLTPSELQILETFLTVDPGRGLDFSIKGTGNLSIAAQNAIAALLNKGCIQSAGINSDTKGIFYSLTPFGRDVCIAATAQLPKYKSAQK